MKAVQRILKSIVKDLQTDNIEKAVKKMNVVRKISAKHGDETNNYIYKHIVGALTHMMFRRRNEAYGHINSAYIAASLPASLV
jgi:hypothetical protein